MQQLFRWVQRKLETKFDSITNDYKIVRRYAIDLRRSR